MKSFIDVERLSMKSSLAAAKYVNQSSENINPRTFIEMLYRNTFTYVYVYSKVFVASFQLFFLGNTLGVITSCDPYKCFPVENPPPQQLVYTERCTQSSIFLRTHFFIHYFKNDSVKCWRVG